MELPPPSRLKSSVDAALADARLRGAVGRAAARLDGARRGAFPDAAAYQELRARGEAIREEALARLDELLASLEAKVKERGGTVHWARDGDEACRTVLDLCRRLGAKEIVKGKSMATEEIALNRFLEREGVAPVETDLGEYIIQLAHDHPAHIIVPAIHHTKEGISDLFQRRLGAEPTTEIPRLTEIARTTLRERFLAAGVGLTGANFAVAETGTIVVVENEGNSRFCNTRPRAHVVVMGIEKVIRRFRDLDVLLKLLTRSATGQPITSYVNVLTGPRRAGEPDGPEELHLILLDNGRTRLLADPVQRASLRCIRCGACLNACPVYSRVGGHAYGWVYPGPIGSVLTPAMLGLGKAADLPFASSLCGACKDACPVRIDLPHLLLDLRQRMTGARTSPGADAPRKGSRRLFSLWAWWMRSPGRYRAAGRLLRLGFPLVASFVKYRPEGRRLPYPAKETFRAQWRRRGGGEGRR